MTLLTLTNSSLPIVRVSKQFFGLAMSRKPVASYPTVISSFLPDLGKIAIYVVIIQPILTLDKRWQGHRCAKTHTVNFL